MSTTSTTNQPETPPIRCTRCKGEDGPFTDEKLCEACARPMPLDGVA